MSFFRYFLNYEYSESHQTTNYTNLTNWHPQRILSVICVIRSFKIGG